MMTFTYPGSRISSSGQCDMCRGFPGDFKERGVILLQTTDRQEVRLLQLTCNYCGYTILFDPSVTNKTPYRGEGSEKVPDFEKKI